jgi:DNA modification methylase
MGGLYRNAHEFIVLFKYGKEAHLDRVKLGKLGRDRTTIWSYPGATTLGSSARAELHTHPTPKSVELLMDGLLDVTERGEVVLDPFAGSGTIFIAAEKIGRLARLHQLGAFFAIFMASDCDKPLESQGWDLRKAL